MKIHRGHNGTADTTGRTSRSVVSARGHNGTADTTGRNTRRIKNFIQYRDAVDLTLARPVRIDPYASVLQYSLYTRYKMIAGFYADWT